MCKVIRLRAQGLEKSENPLKNKGNNTETKAQDDCLKMQGENTEKAYKCGKKYSVDTFGK